MASVNKVMLIGRLGQDPKQSGSAVIFSVATSEKWKDKQGEPQERTEWSNIVCFGRLADVCTQYLKKGSEVFVEGKLQTDKYEKNGQQMYSTKIVANTVQFLSKVSQQTTNTIEDFASGEDAPF